VYEIRSSNSKNYKAHHQIMCTGAQYIQLQVFNYIQSVLPLKLPKIAP
jgi:hypothetical protein